jgi:hypothetical protein
MLVIQYVLASDRGGTGSLPGSMWGLWWTKRHWGRLSPSTSVSPANHSTNFSIIIITRGCHNRPIGDRSAEWTQLDPTPTIPIKKKLIQYVGQLLNTEKIRHSSVWFCFG